MNITTDVYVNLKGCVRKLGGSKVSSRLPISDDNLPHGFCFLQPLVVKICRVRYTLLPYCWDRIKSRQLSRRKWRRLHHISRQPEGEGTLNSSSGWPSLTHNKDAFLIPMALGISRSRKQSMRRITPSYVAPLPSSDSRNLKVNKPCFPLPRPRSTSIVE